MIIIEGRMKETLTYKHVFDSTSNGVIATDSKGIIAFINHRAVKILELNKNKVLGKNIVKVMPLIGKSVIKCLQKGNPQLGHPIYGSRIKLLLNVTPIKKEGGIIGTVSNLQKMEFFESSVRQLESYKQLNKQLKIIFNTSSDGIWVIDGNGIVIDVNKTAKRMNGIKAKDVIGKKTDELVDERIIAKSIIPEILKEKKQISMISKGVKRRFNKLATGTPVFDENKNIKLIVFNERDMTDLLILKDQLEQNKLVTDKYKDELVELRMLEMKQQEFIAESKEIKQVINTAAKLSMIEVSNILIMGETGTGKGFLTKFIHNNSNRRKKPFIQINCAALPDNLLEAELFGYKKGAFTGASEEGKAGLFELAQEGTLFLDEIGELPLSVQAKLLKYFDDKEILPLGGVKSKKINCTIIAATNRDLKSRVKNGRFRQDLFFRLETFTLKIPPLRERRDDILYLVNYFLNKYNEKYRKRTRISTHAMNELLTYQYPGNVRQLKNALKMSVVMSETEIIDEPLLTKLGEAIKHEQEFVSGQMDLQGLSEQMLTFEKEILKKAISQHRSTRQIARHLKTSKSTVARKILKHGLI